MGMKNMDFLASDVIHSVDRNPARSLGAGSTQGRRMSRGSGPVSWGSTRCPRGDTNLTYMGFARGVGVAVSAPATWPTTVVTSSNDYRVAPRPMAGDAAGC